MEMIVEVYKNLHKNLWSVRHKGKVVFYLSAVVIDDAKFVVRPGGRAKVLKEKKKNVHAFVKGKLNHQLSMPMLSLRHEEIKYNPYKYSTFVDLFEKPVYSAKQVILTQDGKCFAIFN